VAELLLLLGTLLPLAAVKLCWRAANNLFDYT
jgi:hypothetical protein